MCQVQDKIAKAAKVIEQIIDLTSFPSGMSLAEEKEINDLALAAYKALSEAK